MNRKFSIIKKSPLWLILWSIFVVLSLFFFFTNDRYSEEFTWWISLWIQWKLDLNTQKENISNYLSQQEYNDIKVSLQLQWDITIIKIHTEVVSDYMVAELSNEIKNYLLENDIIDSPEQIIQQTITWPSVWSYMQKAALRALIVWLIFIIIYMLFSFSAIREYISPATLIIVTIITMFFDISIPAWAYWLRMHFNSTIQIDTVFIIAILTTMWYSINDTIIIFDRIRENFKNKSTWKDILYWEVFEKSLWQTIKRSLFTSFSTLLIIIAMFIFWSSVMQQFAFVIWIWVISWSFSSIFIAAPLAYMSLGRYKKENKKFK